MKKLALLLIIIGLGFFLRAQETLSGNFLFLKDQGRDLLAVKTIVVDEKLTLIGPYTGLQAVFQGPLYYYLISIPFALSGGSPRVIMVLALLANILSLPGIYWIGKKFFSADVGLASALLLSLSPAAAAAATFLWSPFFALPISVVSLYFLLLWARQGKPSQYLWLAATVGVLYHFEIAFAAPFTLVVFVVTWYVSKFRRYKLPLFSSALVILLFLSPLILFDFRHEHITSRSLLQLFLGSAQGLSGAGESYTKIVRDHFIQFFLRFKGMYVAADPLSSITSFMAVVSGIGYFAWGKNFNAKLLLVLPATLFIVYMAYPFQLYDWYLVGLFPVYALLGGVALVWFTKNLFGRALFAVFIFILLQQSIGRLQQLYAVPDYGGTAKIRGKLEAIDRVYQDAGGKPFNLLVFTPVVLTDAYDYLLWWHGEKVYGFLPGREKKDTLYLLIEPDPAKPWTYQGWLETEVKSGKILETQELPSGFIIQKRQV